MTGSAVGWPARLPSTPFGPPVASPCHGGHAKEIFSSASSSGSINTARAELLQPLTFVICTRPFRLCQIPAPAWRPSRAAPVPPNTAPPCAALRAVSAALRTRLDVRLPLSLPAVACCPCDTTCFSLLRTSEPCPANAGLGSARAYGSVAVRCALLRDSGEAWLPLASACGCRPSTGPIPQQALRALSRRARHHPPHRALGSFPPMGRSASQRLRRKRLRRGGFAAAASPHLGRHLFRGHSVCTGDARFSQRDRRRFCALPAFVNRLC